MKSVEISKNRKVGKLSFAVAVGIALLAGSMLLAGCSSAVGEDVGNRLEDLENRVKVLEDKVITRAEEGNDVLKSFSDKEDYAAYDKYLSEIEKSVSDAVVATEPGSIPTDADKRDKAYNKAVEPFSDLEYELAHLEAAFEAANANGTVSDDQLVQLSAYAEKIYGDINVAIANLRSSYGIAG